MNKTARNLTWNCLPLEVKKEVKRQYQIAINAKEYYTECTLEYLFGIHNLTSDAEGEEMLYAKRKWVQEMYKNNCDEIRRENISSSDRDCYEYANEVLKTFFGSKCLPDDGDELSPEPKPAEPTCTNDCPSQCPSPGKEVSKDSANCDKQFDTIIKDGFHDHNRLYIAAMLAAGMAGTWSDTPQEGSIADKCANLAELSFKIADALIEQSQNQ